ncbi:uncharacterized protein A4U43_C08F23430, partial [Asparagus officinalis]
ESWIQKILMSLLYLLSPTKQRWEKVIKRIEELRVQLQDADPLTKVHQLKLSTVLDEVAGKIHGGYERGYVSSRSRSGNNNNSRVRANGGLAPFLMKTHEMVDDEGTKEVISWGENGTTFVVWKPVEFARDLLPVHFKHCNFSSFVRQLNTYVRSPRLLALG